MTWPGIIFSTGASFLFLLLVFRPLELALPARSGQRLLRPHFFVDLCFFLGQYLLWSGAVLWVLTHFGSWVTSVIPQSFRHGIASQPWWLQVIQVIFLSDLFVYWGHRFQ